MEGPCSLGIVLSIEACESERDCVRLTELVCKVVVLFEYFNQMIHHPEID